MRGNTNPSGDVLVEADEDHPNVWLRRFRWAMRMHQSEVGDLVGRSQVVVSRWEARLGPPPGIAAPLFLAMGAPREVAEQFRTAVVRAREKAWANRTTPSGLRAAAKAR